MKYTLLILALAGSLLSASAVAESRTWTSADGSKTFEGTLRQYVETTGDVTVLYPNGTATTFKDSVLSEADREWLKSNAGKPAQAGAAGGGELSEIGKMAEKNLHILEDSRFQRHTLTKNPEVYVLMFSASWCPPCRAAAPGAVKDYNAHVKDNPKVDWIHISADRDEKAALEWAKKEKMPWATVLPGKRTPLSKFATNSVPRYVLVNAADGKVLAEGLAACMSAIKKLGE